MKGFARNVRVGRLKMLYPVAFEASCLGSYQGAAYTADPLLTVMPPGLSPVEQTARILSVTCTNRNVL